MFKYPIFRKYHRIFFLLFYLKVCTISCQKRSLFSALRSLEVQLCLFCCSSQTGIVYIYLSLRTKIYFNIEITEGAAYDSVDFYELGVNIANKF